MAGTGQEGNGGSPRVGGRPLRRRLAAIVTQAWLIGAVGGSLIDFAALSLAGTLPDGFLPSVPSALRDILAVSAVPYAVGLALVLAAPAFALRFRVALCCLMVVAATGTAAAVSGSDPEGVRIVVGLVLLDAGLAALWCWHRTKALRPDPLAQLAATFE